MKKIIVILSGCLLLGLFGCMKKENNIVSNNATSVVTEKSTLSEDEKINEEKYQIGIKNYAEKNYQDALDDFSALDDYKDAKKYVKKCKYEIAGELCEKGKYEDAILIYTWLNEYKDAKEKGENCKELYQTQLYTELEDNYLKGNYVEAYELTNSPYMARYKNVSEIKNKIVDEGKQILINDFEDKYKSADFSALDLYKDLCDDEYQKQYWYLYGLDKIQGIGMADKSDDYVSIDGWNIFYQGNEYSLVPQERTVKNWGNTQSISVYRFADNKMEIYLSSSGYYFIVDLNNIGAEEYYPGSEAVSYHTYDYKELKEKQKEELAKAIERKQTRNILSVPCDPEMGMTKVEVENSTWGKPDHINKTTYTWGVEEQWCYDNAKYIYFKDGVVDCIQE